MPYVVVSFDFGGSSDVRIHALTDDIENAKKVHSQLDANSPAAREGYQRLIQVVRLPGEYVSREGHCLFWGRSNDEAVTVECNNGRPFARHVTTLRECKRMWPGVDVLRLQLPPGVPLEEIPARLEAFRESHPRLVEAMIDKMRPLADEVAPKNGLLLLAGIGEGDVAEAELLYLDDPVGERCGVVRFEDCDF